MKELNIAIITVSDSRDDKTDKSMDDLPRVEEFSPNHILYRVPNKVEKYFSKVEIIYEEVSQHPLKRVHCKNYNKNSNIK